LIAGTTNLPAGGLAWDRQGEGPVIVLLHGATLDRRMWEPQMAALSRRFSVLRYDLRGYGASPVPAGPYSHVADLKGLIEALDLARPILVGLSLGANVALGFALAHPELTGGLVLASPGLPGHDWGAEKRPPEAAAIQAKAHGTQAARAFWLDHPLFASLADFPNAAAAVRQIVGDYHGWHWTHADPIRDPTDLADRLSDVATPTLILSGGRDVAGYRAIAARIAAAVPDVRLEALAEAGHMLNLEQPDRCNELIRSYLAGVNIDDRTQ
jgi:pimeloyl-ACP methyl ester carboxylesterase